MGQRLKTGRTLTSLSTSPQTDTDFCSEAQYAHMYAHNLTTSHVCTACNCLVLVVGKGLSHVLVYIFSYATVVYLHSALAQLHGVLRSDTLC